MHDGRGIADQDIVGRGNVQTLDLGLRPMRDFLLEADAAMPDQRNIEQILLLHDGFAGKRVGLGQQKPAAACCRAGKGIPISQCLQTPAERQNPGWRGPIAPSHRLRRCCKTEKCRPGYSCRTTAAACRIKGSGFPPIETSRLIYGASALSVIFRFPRRNSGFPPNHDNPFCMSICDRTLPAVY